MSIAEKFNKQDKTEFIDSVKNLFESDRVKNYYHLTNVIESLNVENLDKKLKSFLLEILVKSCYQLFIRAKMFHYGRRGMDAKYLVKINYITNNELWELSKTYNGKDNKIIEYLDSKNGKVLSNHKLLKIGKTIIDYAVFLKQEEIQKFVDIFVKRIIFRQSSISFTSSKNSADVQVGHIRGYNNYTHPRSLIKTNNLSISVYMGPKFGSFYWLRDFLNFTKNIKIQNVETKEVLDNIKYGNIKVREGIWGSRKNVYFLDADLKLLLRLAQSEFISFYYRPESDCLSIYRPSNQGGFYCSKCRGNGSLTIESKETEKKQDIYGKVSYIEKKQDYEIQCPVCNGYKYDKNYKRRFILHRL